MKSIRDEECKLRAEFNLHTNDTYPEVIKILILRDVNVFPAQIIISLS